MDRFVITHGTYTLEETTIFLNLTVKTTKPVVITEAMKTTTALGPDRPSNLYGSMVIASSNLAYNKGVPIIYSTRLRTVPVTIPNNSSTFNPQKSRVLLQLVLTKSKEQDVINSYFSTY